MLIFRYLVKEVFTTLAALTLILLLIFMSNQFVHYLNRAVSGHIPVMIIMKLLILEMPNLIGLLLPLGFFVALLLAYGRLYADSEMLVLHASGYSPKRLLTHSFIMVAMVSLPVIIIMFWLSPTIAVERIKLLRTTGIQTLIENVIPGRFQEVTKGKNVFYVESMSHDRKKAKNVFLARLTIHNHETQWNIVWSDEVYAATMPETGDNFLVFKQGEAYEGMPGQANYQVINFKEYNVKLPPPVYPLAYLTTDLRTAKTAALLPLINADSKKAAELQWRLSVPIMIFTLTLLAVPLSRVNPRAGRFAKLLPAIMLYIIYANFMFIARDWLAGGTVPVWIGMWWLHLAFLILGGFLFRQILRKTG